MDTEHNIDSEKFNTDMIKSNWEKTLKRTAEEHKIKIVYN